jgi:IS30 family transposase
MMGKYHQLTYEQRCQISVLNRSDMSQKSMADTIGVCEPTISCTLARNSGQRSYRHTQAQARAKQRREAAKTPAKMLPPWVTIWRDKRTGGDLYLDLRQQGKKYDKRRNGKSTRGQVINRVCIDDRPSVVDSKSRVGDWEIDTVIGKGHSGALVTIVERKMKFTVSVQVMSKRAADVTEATIRLRRPYKALVYAITADNGKEVARHEKISEALDAKVYFAHSYSF